MLSRVADSIYWMNRYVERTENIARFINVNLNLSLDSPIGVVQQWEPLIRTTGDLAIFQQKYGDATADNVIRFLTFDKTYPNSIISCLNAARENARSVREIISSEMWQQINAFYHFVNDAAVADQLDFPTFFSEVKLASHLFAGIASATMTHSEAWHFGLIGRWLERSDKTSRIVDVKYFILLPSIRDVGTTLDQLQWMALLRSASAYEMYRKRGVHRITPTSVAEFLVLDREFPRSIRYCIRQAERSLHQITGTPEGTWNTSVERSLGRLRADLDYLTIEDVMESGLHEFLDNLQQRMNDVGIRLSETFFAVQPL
ncbi:MAG: alpha-E domain-containing protein [Leptolyngbya sp. Prado105]|nr:alpha-E domain-containing protein [Leptolyngbya sp. Prado105]